MNMITRFFSLSFHEKLILLKLMMYIIRAELIFRLMPYSISRRFIFSETNLHSTIHVNQIECVYLYVRLLRSLCKQLPWKPTCLRIAVALRDALKTAGIHSVIKFGVCRNDKLILAHAWLESCGVEVLKNGIYSELI